MKRLKKPFNGASGLLDVPRKTVSGLAFAYAAFNPTCAPEVAMAVQNRKPRLALEQLKLLRRGMDVTQRLHSQPDKCLAEVALGFDLAHMVLLRQSPQTELTRPLLVELEAPELLQPLQALKSELIDKFVGLKGSVVRCANIAPLITEPWDMRE